MVKLALSLFAVFLTLSATEAYKILAIFPFPGKSHGILGEGFVRHLLNAGHEVTNILAFPQKDPHPNLTQVVAESNFKIFSENTINIKAVMDKTQDFLDISFILQLMRTLSDSTVQDKNVQKLLRDPSQKFDLVIAEWMFSEVYSAIPALYDCPFIWFSTLEPHGLVLRLIDGLPNPAYITDYITNYQAPYSFIRRIEQLWSLIKQESMKRTLKNEERQVYEKSIAPIIRERGKVVPKYEDLIYNISLMLGNSHVSLGTPMGLPQNYKPIGGYHIDTRVKALPQDLKKIIDNSKHGVIYFSMGSNLKSKDIPNNLKEGFLKVFSSLKQTVIWKFEEELSDLPKNVNILKWAPQQSILAHPNVILFITHGGLLSTTEAVHFGKPIIGIPVFADQFANVERAIKKGFARKVLLSYTMDKDMQIEIDEILRNSSYAKKAKEWSFIYHDRPATPGQELVHWVEHVVKTGGAQHLRSLALMVPWYQKMYLDLLILLIGVLIIFIYVSKTILRRLLINIKSCEKKKKLK